MSYFIASIVHGEASQFIEQLNNIDTINIINNTDDSIDIYQTNNSIPIDIIYSENIPIIVNQP